MTNRYYYTAVKLENGIYCQVTDEDFSSEWNDYEYVRLFERNLAKYFSLESHIVEISGGRFESCEIYIPEKEIDDAAYVKVTLSGIPFTSQISDEATPNLQALKASMDSLRKSEQFYHNYYTSLDNNYLHPFCKNDLDKTWHALDLMFLTKSAHILLVGPAGSGKTSMVRRLAYSLNSRIASEESKKELTPLYFSLRNFTNFKSQIRHSIDESAKSLSYGYFNYQKSRSRLLYIFDGIDELNAEYQKDFTNWIEVFKKEDPSARILITSREIELIKNEVFQHFEKIEIQPLVFNQIREYSHRHLGSSKAARTFMDFMKADENLIKLISNPLTLSLTLSLYIYKHILPYNVGELIKEIVYHLTENWDEKRSIKRYRTVNPKTARTILGKLAYKLQIKNQFTFKESFLKNLVTFDLQETPESSILREIKENTGLIFKTPNNLWSFSHRYFQDFFCASYLIEKSGSVEEDYSLFKFKESWLNVWNQAAELSSDPEFYIADVSSKRNDLVHSTDRLYSILLAKNKLDNKNYKNASKKLKKNLETIGDEIYSITNDTDSCRVKLKVNSRIGNDEMIQLILKTYYLTNTEYTEMLDFTSSITKIARLINYLKGLPSAPKWSTHKNEIVLEKNGSHQWI